MAVLARTADLLVRGLTRSSDPDAADSDRGGCGTAERWGLDQQTGLIAWTFADKTATAPAQILASYNATSSTWLWAWANESILPAMSHDARKLRDWALQHGHRSLAEAKVAVDADTAATLGALAVRITPATGFYRPKNGAAIPIITFGPVTLTTSDGTSSTFTINID